MGVASSFALNAARLTQRLWTARRRYDLFQGVSSSGLRKSYTDKLGSVC